VKTADNAKPVESLRERKRRQTRERLINVASSLFLKKGFDAVTVDEIAAAADTTKRTFFDYFPSKEEVIAAWQADFGTALAAAVRQRPENEPLTVSVERAFLAAISEAAKPRSIAIARLIENTPALRAREHLKYARLEEMLADALIERVQDPEGRFRARMLAVIIIGALRLSSDDSGMEKRNSNKEVLAYTQKMFDLLWSVLRELGQSASASKK
jgi:AcrR family transcriptional regulator